MIDKQDLYDKLVANDGEELIYWTKNLIPDGVCRNLMPIGFKLINNEIRQWYYDRSSGSPDFYKIRCELSEIYETPLEGFINMMEEKGIN